MPWGLSVVHARPLLVTSLWSAVISSGLRALDARALRLRVVGEKERARACLRPVSVASVRSRSGDAVGSQRRPRRLSMVPSVRPAVIAELPRARRPRPPSRCRAAVAKRENKGSRACLCPVSVSSVRSRSGDAAGSQCRPRPSAAGLAGLVRGDLVELPRARCPHPPSPCLARVSTPRVCPVPAPCPPPPSGPALTNPPRNPPGDAHRRPAAPVPAGRKPATALPPTTSQGGSKVELLVRKFVP